MRILIGIVHNEIDAGCGTGRSSNKSRQLRFFGIIFALNLEVSFFCRTFAPAKRDKDTRNLIEVAILSSLRVEIYRGVEQLVSVSGS